MFSVVVGERASYYGSGVGGVLCNGRVCKGSGGVGERMLMEELEVVVVVCYWKSW